MNAYNYKIKECGLNMCMWAVVREFYRIMAVSNEGSYVNFVAIITLYL